MRVVPTTMLACGIVAALARPAAGQQLSFEEAMQRARTRAPEVLAAVTRVDEARARRRAAAVRQQDNPFVDVAAGPRRGGAGTWDVSVAIAQPLDPWGQRAARMAAADAEVTVAERTADESARLAVREVAFAYARASAADARVSLLSDVERVVDDLRTATERRYQAGDVAALDLNLTRIAAARARASRLRAEGEREDALRPLRAALGIDGPVVLSPDVLDRTPGAEATLAAAVARGPVVRRLDAELTHARAEQRLAATQGRPRWTPSVSFAREADDRILLGGLSIALPLFNRGQQLSGEAEARARRLHVERDTTLRVLATDLAASLRVYTGKRRAADTLRDTALPAAADNETLASRSLQAGQIGLLDFLLVRQDVTATRLSYLDARLEAALAALDADALAGVL